ncbi:MAG: arginase family protein [Pseudomonadota bacterium]
MALCLRRPQRTFCDLPFAPLNFDGRIYDGLRFHDVDVAVFGAPHGTPYAPGQPSHAAEAPDALRRALAWYAVGREQIDMDTGRPVMGRTIAVDCGDVTGSLTDGAANRRALFHTTQALRDAGCIPLMLGGDDSTPIPFIAGFEDREIWVVQVDAHLDWRQEVDGVRHGFSSTMRRASEMDHVAGIVQIGARGPGSARAEDLADAAQWGAQIFPMHVLHRDGLSEAIEAVPRGALVVLAFDTDALDPSLNPGVLLPAFGGLSYNQTLDLIHGVADRSRIIGAAFVEYVPEKDPASHGAQAIARIACNLIDRMGPAE